MSSITVNVEQEDKELFNTICNKMGMNISTAINIFIKKVNATRSIPFALELEPEWNEETIAAFEESKAISEGQRQADIQKRKEGNQNIILHKNQPKKLSGQ